MPATIVDPPASMTCTLGGRSPSSVLERIQTTRPASTRTLASFRNDGPLGSARAASRYKVGRGMIMECPSSSVSRSAFKEGVAKPDQPRVRLEPLCLREECPEPRVAVVLLVGLVIRGDDVEEIILNPASLLASPARTDEAGLEEPTSAREVVPDRDFLGLEHRFEILRMIRGDSEDNRRRLRRLGRGDFGFPRHASTMLGRLLKSKPVTDEKGLPVSRDGPAVDSNIVRERASHPKPTVLSDFILGSQDGIVNVLGIILDLSAATRDVRIILVATLAALGAESIAMGAVAYTSTRARRRLYLSQVVQERREMEEVPQTERDEVREILAGWGYKDADLEEIVERICRNPTAELEFMMSFELKLSPVEAGAPRASAFLVGTATVVGHFIPLSPFFFVGSDVLLGAVLAILLSGVAVFGIGWYEAKITVGSWWREGLEMLVIGLGGGVAGYVIGQLVGAG